MRGWSFLGAAGKVCRRNSESAWWASDSQAHKVVQRAAMAVTVAAEHMAGRLPGKGAGVQQWAQEMLNAGSRTAMQLYQQL